MITKHSGRIDDAEKMESSWPVLVPRENVFEIASGADIMTFVGISVESAEGLSPKSTIIKPMIKLSAMIDPIIIFFIFIPAFSWLSWWIYDYARYGPFVNYNK
jgi:hypothetical protein